MTVRKKAIEMEACLLELNIAYIAPHKFYGPKPVQHAWGVGGRGPQGTVRVEHKWNQQYETLTALGKSWRAAL